MKEIREHSGWRIRYAFMDESGDLGRFGIEYFVISVIVVEDPKVLRKIVKNTRKRKLKRRMKDTPELKANRSSPEVREYLLRQLASTDCEIFAIVVEKSKIMPHLYEVKDRLYNFISRIVFTEMRYASGLLKIMVDRKETNSMLQKNFEDYIIRELSNRRPELKIEIRQCDSQQNAELQVADFVAWAIARKFNFGEEKYFQIIEEKLVNRKRMMLWE